MLKTITIPLAGYSSPHFIKKLGDFVFKNDKIAECLQNTHAIEIDIAENLHVKATSVSSLLLKNLGDSVSKDEVIARTQKGFFVKKTYEVKSLFDGKIFELDNFSGKIKIVGLNSKKDLLSPVSGTIKELDSEKIVIEFKADEIDAKKIFGQSFIGELEKVGGVKDDVLAGKIESSMRGKILLGGHFSLSDLNRAMAMGVSGVIASFIAPTTIEKFENNKTFSFIDNECKISISFAICEEKDFLRLSKLENGADIYFDVPLSKILIPHK